MKNLPTFAEKADSHQDQYFEQLLQTAEYLAMDMETQAMYEKRLKEMRDIQNVERYFRRVTLAEGEAKEKAKIAKNLLALGVPMETIVAATGLTEQEVRLL